MIPVYFPFTYVSRPTATRLARWFDELGILAPAADTPPPSGPGSLTWQIFSPPPGDEALLGGLETEWRRWAEMHTGADLAAVMAARQADGPFAATPAISSLRSRIRAGAADPSAVADSDPLLAARIFLRLAHGRDRDQDVLGTHLDQVADLERRMRRQMDGEAGDPVAPGGQPPGEDAGALLTERRLAAWARLALALEVAADVLVTDSPAVMAALEEAVGPLAPLRALAPAEAGRLLPALGQALGSDSGPGAAVHLVDLPPAALLQRLAAGPGGPTAPTAGPDGCLLVFFGIN